uniref:LIM zinc-binding domain-containing protein n=1 Tax=Heterorhabditis bacteriophora TaxID=37862 RepID=A0A1I7WUJ5_HETBA
MATFLNRSLRPWFFYNNIASKSYVVYQNTDLPFITAFFQVLSALNKKFHPSCFRCFACGICLNGVPFALDKQNNVYCMPDYHERFAYRCKACKKPILPDPETGETVRIVTLENDYHVDCYVCEVMDFCLTQRESRKKRPLDGCGLRLSEESESRCYPLGTHLLCEKCHIHWRRSGEVLVGLELVPARNAFIDDFLDGCGTIYPLHHINRATSPIESIPNFNFFFLHSQNNCSFLIYYLNFFTIVLLSPWNSIRWNKPTAANHRSQSSSIAARFDSKPSYSISPATRAVSSTRYTNGSLSSAARTAAELASGLVIINFSLFLILVAIYIYIYQYITDINDRSICVLDIATLKMERPWRQRMAEASRIRATHGDDVSASYMAARASRRNSLSQASGDELANSVGQLRSYVNHSSGYRSRQTSVDSSVYGPLSRFSTSYLPSHTKLREDRTSKYMSRSGSPSFRRQSSQESIREERSTHTVSTVPKNPSIRESSRERDSEKSRKRSSRERNIINIAARRNSRQGSHNMGSSSSEDEADRSHTRAESKRRRRKKKIENADETASLPPPPSLAVTKSMQSSIYETGIEDTIKNSTTELRPGAATTAAGGSCCNLSIDSCLLYLRKFCFSWELTFEYHGERRFPIVCRYSIAPSIQYGWKTISLKFENQGSNTDKKSNYKLKIFKEKYENIGEYPKFSFFCLFFRQLTHRLRWMMKASIAQWLILSLSRSQIITRITKRLVFFNSSPKVKRIAPVPGLWKKSGGEEFISKNKAFVREAQHSATFCVWTTKPKETIVRRCKVRSLVKDLPKKVEPRRVPNLKNTMEKKDILKPKESTMKLPALKRAEIKPSTVPTVKVEDKKKEELKKLTPIKKEDNLNSETKGKLITLTKNGDSKKENLATIKRKDEKKDEETLVTKGDEKKQGQKVDESSKSRKLVGKCRFKMIAEYYRNNWEHLWRNISDLMKLTN